LVVLLADDLLELSLAAQTSNADRLPLGLAQAAFIELPARRERREGDETLVIHWSPPQTRIVVLESKAKSLRGLLLRLAFHLHVTTSRVVEVDRRLTIGRDGDRLFLEAPAEVSLPGDWPERIMPAARTHLSHIIDLAARRQAQDTLPLVRQGPLISFIIPVYNARTDHLDDLLRSFRLQQQGLAELIFTDDASTAPATRDWLIAHQAVPNVTVVFNAANAGISAATNAGIMASCGAWISFIDHDDALTPFCIREIARTLHNYPDCEFLYTDEVITDEALTVEGYFLKPAWDPVLLSGVNYVNHLSLYRRQRLDALGGLRPAFDGSQDYDLLLRYTTGLAPHQIRHLPFPAYLWRRSTTTYSARFMEKATLNARTAIAERYESHGALPIEGAIDPNLHRVRFDRIRTEWPVVSVIIPSRDSHDLIQTILIGLFEKTDYPRLEIIVVDNGTTDQRTLDLYELYKHRDSFRVFIEPAPFNFSAAVNKGIGHAHGDLFLLLNNDIEITSADWLREMVSCFDYGDVGIVGAKLLYPSGKLQHAGVIAGLGGLAGHWFIEADGNFPGPMGRLWVRQTFSCVTGACMLVSRECWQAVGPFDDINFAIAYNDIDFCLRATNAGFRVVWTPFACHIHHESASRGSDEAPEKIDRFRREQANLRRIHATDILEDRSYSPWFSRMSSRTEYLRRALLPESR
jgi:GT2 family glycosyltransferase